MTKEEKGDAAMAEANRKREDLKAALRRLHEAGPKDLARVKREVVVYFRKAEPAELAMAEQELIKEGVGRQEMKRLCDVHLEVMKQQLGRAVRGVKLPASHPISILKDEHKIIKRNLKKLARTLEKIKAAGSFGKGKRSVDALKELSHFFLETEKHHQREEEGIFPRLVAHGITEPPEIFKEDHVEFKAKKKNLSDLAMSAGTQPFGAFLASVQPLVEFLTKNLEDHIYKEDHVLYPMSLTTLEPGEWQEVRKKFDSIGYCCFAPADLKRSTPAKINRGRKYGKIS